MFQNRYRLILCKNLMKYMQSHILNLGIIRIHKGPLSVIFLPKKSYSDDSDKTDVFSKDGAESNLSNLSNPNKASDIFRIHTKLKPDFTTQTSLLDEVKNIFQAANSDIKSFGSTTVKSNFIIKDINRTLSKKKWSPGDAEKFISSEEFNTIRQEILLHQDEMGPGSLKEIITFLELLKFSKDSYVPLGLIYSTWEKKKELFPSNNIDDTFDGSEKETNFTQEFSEPETSDILSKLKQADENDLPESETIKILQEASSTKTNEMTPIFLTTYYNVLSKLSPKIISQNHIYLEFGLKDHVNLLSKQHGTEFIRELPNILLHYAGRVVFEKGKYSKEGVDAILEKIRNPEAIAADHHFIVLKAMNILSWTEDGNHVKYLRYFIMNHVIGNPELLESVDNLDVFLESLRISNFHRKYENQWGYLKSIMSNLSVLKNEEQWKNLHTTQLQRTVNNLILLQICPNFLSSSAGRATENHLVNLLGDLESDSSLSDDENIEMTLEILHNRSRMTPESMINYYKLLDKIRLDHPKLSLVKKAYKNYKFRQVFCNNKNSAQQIPTFLSIYAKVVTDGKEWFSRRLIQNSTLELMSDEEITIDQHFLALESFNTMKTYSSNYVQHVVKLVLENKTILEESIKNLHTFLESLGTCNYPTKYNNQWPYLKSFIQNLSIIKYEDKWESAELSHLIYVTKNLALFGIYSDSLLRFVSQKINEKPVDDPKLWSTLLVLNQALDILHPSFRGYLLSNETLQNIFKSHNEIESEESSSFVSDVKSTLELEAYEKDVFLTNYFTKLCLKIDLILALDESDQPFSFTSFLEKPPKKCYLEDISLPDNYELVLICFFQNKNCIKENLELDTDAQLKLKTFEAMGYTVVPILCREWMDAGDNKGSHFWNKIIADNKCSIPTELLEKAREPVMGELDY